MTAKKALLSLAAAGCFMREAPRPGPVSLAPEEKALEVLLDGSLGPDARVREACTLGLRYGGPRAVHALLALLGDQESSVRATAAWVLGEMAEKKAAPALTRALSDESVRVRVSAARALGVCGGKEAALSALKAARVRSKPAAALSSGWAGAQEARKELERMLTERDREAKAFAAAALGRLGATGLLRPVLTRLSRSPEPEARAACAWTIGEMGGNGAGFVSILGGLCVDRERAVRKAAADALGWVGGKEAEAHLVNLLADSEENVRRSGLRALSRVGSAEVWEGLAALLPDSLAAETLASVLDERDPPPPSGALDALEDAKTPACLAALVKLGREEKTDELVAFLRSKDPALRAEAARSLGRLSAGAAGAAGAELRELLSDPNARVRVEAASALLRLGRMTRVPPAPGRKS